MNKGVANHYLYELLFAWKTNNDSAWESITSLLMRPGRNMFSGAPEDMSSINNKKQKMDICDKIDNLFEDKLIKEVLREADIIFGSNWRKLPSQCNKEEFYQQFPQAPEHAYSVAKICWGIEAKF